MEAILGNSGMETFYAALMHVQKHVPIKMYAIYSNRRFRSFFNTHNENRVEIVKENVKKVPNTKKKKQLAII